MKMRTAGAGHSAVCGSGNAPSMAVIAAAAPARRRRIASAGASGGQPAPTVVRQFDSVSTVARRSAGAAIECRSPSPGVARPGNGESDRRSCPRALQRAASGSRRWPRGASSS
jgi:hypothetical protein